MALPAFVGDPLRASLEGSGFTKQRGDLYWLDTADGIDVIEFVSKGGPRNQAYFTAHLGYWSRRLAAVFGPDRLTTVEPHAVHWFRGIEYLSESDFTDGEGWWVFEGDDNGVTAIVDEVERRAIPALKRVSTDAGLRDDWLAAADLFLHRSEQTAYLAVLVNALGPASERERLVLEIARLAENGASDAAAALAVIRAQDG